MLERLLSRWRTSTHRDNVNPDEDLYGAVHGDPSADFADSTISGFVPVLLVFLCHFIQAEPPLRVDTGALHRWRCESAATERLDGEALNLKKTIHLKFADESLFRRPFFFSRFSAEELICVYPVAETPKFCLQLLVVQLQGRKQTLNLNLTPS